MTIHQKLRAAEIDFEELQTEFNRNLEQIEALKRKNVELNEQGHKLRGRIEALKELAEEAGAPTNQ